ncbi:MAG: V-type ATP synthase subunit E [Brevinemataceae bacterium]
MALEDIQKKIIADAEQKKQLRLEAAEKQKAEILKETKHHAEKYQQESDKNAQNLGANIKRGLIIDARRSLANNLLERKRVHIKDAFDKAKQEFISSADYPVMMKQLVLKAAVKKSEKIILGKNENYLNTQWLNDLNQSCGGSFSFSTEPGNFIGGLFLQEEDSLVNISLDTLFSLLREDVERSVADMMFKE